MKVIEMRNGTSVKVGASEERLLQKHFESMLLTMLNG